MIRQIHFLYDLHRDKIFHETEKKKKKNKTKKKKKKKKQVQQKASTTKECHKA